MALSPDDSVADEVSSVVLLLSFSSMVVPCSSLPLDVDAVDDDIFASMLSLVVGACPGPTPDDPVLIFSSCRVIPRLWVGDSSTRKLIITCLNHVDCVSIVDVALKAVKSFSCK